MKTQLLEDMGENAPLSPPPAQQGGTSKAGKPVSNPAPAGKVETAQPRAAPGGSKQKAPEAAPLIATPQPDDEAAPLDLDSVFEEIANLEAQYVAPLPPVPQRATAAGPGQPPPALPARPAEPVNKLSARPAEPALNPPAPPLEPLSQPVMSPAEPTLAPHSAPAAIAPQDPRFDFTPPAPAQPVPPIQQHAPVSGALEPPPAITARPVEPLNKFSARPDEPTLAPHPAPRATAPQGPLFDVTPPSAGPRVAPVPRYVPVGAPVERPHAIPASPAEPVSNFSVRPAEPTLAPHPTHSARAPQDPLFDFTPPSPALETASPFTPASTRPRYLLWIAGLLAAALLLLGGWWLYQERTDAGSLALAAGQAKQQAQAGAAADPAEPAAPQSTPQAGDPTGADAAPAVPATRPAPAVPPLVLLEPGASAPARAEPAPAPPETAQKTDPVAEQAPASPSPKPSSRAAVPAREKGVREPVRQPARAPAAAAETPPAVDTTMTATLKACRELGYDAAQCVKRGCSMTQYGLACRGR